MSVYLKYHQVLLPDGTKVGVSLHHSRDGRQYWVHKRRGFPPVVRRQALDATELTRVYKNDNIIRS
jgi:hypothetical protein